MLDSWGGITGSEVKAQMHAGLSAGSVGHHAEEEATLEALLKNSAPSVDDNGSPQKRKATEDAEDTPAKKSKLEQSPSLSAGEMQKERNSLWSTWRTQMNKAKVDLEKQFKACYISMLSAEKERDKST